MTTQSDRDRMKKERSMKAALATPRSAMAPRAEPGPASPSKGASGKGAKSAGSGASKGATGNEYVYGHRAALAVLKMRPDDIVGVGISSERREDAHELIALAERRGLPWSELPDAELARIAHSTSHEGLVLETKPRRWLSLTDVADGLIRNRGFAVAFDRVRNPYNVGAILRSAAFFGMEAAILGALAPHPALAPDAVRVAEGGAEHLRFARTTDLAESLSRLRGRGLRVVGAESDGPHELFTYAWHAPTVLVLGHEREGLSPRVRSVCDALVKIPGSGSVDSLNVGIAASLFISELARTRTAR